MKKSRFTIAVAVCTTALIVSVAAGSLSAVFLNGEQNNEIYRYLSGFFAAYSENIDKTAVCRRSLEMNMRIFIPVVMFGWFFFGTAAAALCVAVKGFVWGFCGGIYIKYYGIKGLLISAVSFPSYIIVICAVIVFAGFAAELYSEKEKKGIYYMIMALVLLVVLSLSALIDGFGVCPAVSAVIPIL